MDHDVVVREKMTEKYLLEELEPKLKDEFEEHFFDCPECALDVRAASEFVSGSKIVLVKSPEPVPVHAAIPAPPPFNRGWFASGWFAWLRPAIAVPVFALLLAVIGYQNLVTLPQLMQMVNKPQVLPATTVSLLTYGANAAPLVVHPGEGFLLNVIVPPGHRYQAYKVDLYTPAGGVESVPISASPDDTWPIRFPGGNLQSGAYKLTVHGVTASGQNVEIGSSSFQLQVQK
jgi:hypothetical protein